LFVGVADENHGLVDMVQFDFLIGLFFEQIAMSDLASLPLDSLGNFYVGHQITHVTLFGGNIAHKLEQQIVVADSQILHTISRERDLDATGWRGAAGGLAVYQHGETLAPSSDQS
jgi:hypothetical protein